MKSKLIPIKQVGQGKWVSPAQAAKLAHNGKGIALSTMMNKIYSGSLNGFVKCDHLGSWWVWVEDVNSSPLKAA